ncbi:MAG: hypothetical protein IJZ75_00595 [Clostridia bacterium]|nr:hypothetical protein [Clostridia bacterium]
MPDKKRRISVEIDAEMEALIKERIDYLQSKRPGTKVTISDAVRQALYSQSYKRGKKSNEEC